MTKIYTQENCHCQLCDWRSQARKAENECLRSALKAADEENGRLRSALKEADESFLACARAVGVSYEAEGLDGAPGPLSDVLGAIREDRRKARECDEWKGRARELENALKAADEALDLVRMTYGCVEGCAGDEVNACPECVTDRYVNAARSTIARALNGGEP